MSRRTAVLELVFAGALWGFGFIATVWALAALEPMSLVAGRFALAFVICLPFLLLSRRGRASLTLDQWRMAFWPGVLLGATLLLQTWGLKYTTATKSGFITTLYTLIVPLLESRFLLRPVPKLHWALVALGLVGIALIVDLQIADMNIGDLLTLGCAVVAAGQILMIGMIGPHISSPFAFNTLQCFWAFALVLLPALIFDPLPQAELFQGEALAGLLALVFGSTIIAFMLQVRAQKILPPSTSSLLFLLESPFAALFAIWILNEQLSFIQALGAGLIFLTVLAATRLEALR